MRFQQFIIDIRWLKCVLFMHKLISLCKNIFHSRKNEIFIGWTNTILCIIIVSIFKSLKLFSALPPIIEWIFSFCCGLREVWINSSRWSRSSIPLVVYLSFKFFRLLHPVQPCFDAAGTSHVHFRHWKPDRVLKCHK